MIQGNDLSELKINNNPQGFAEKFAWWISQLFSPPLLSLSAIIIQTWSIHSKAAWLWAAFYISFGILIPLGFVVRQYKKGQISDIDLSRRKDRYRPMLMLLACAGIATAIMNKAGAPTELIKLVSIMWLLSLAILIITFLWKISVHCATCAGVCTLILLLGNEAMPLIIGAPAMVWSRTKLQAHSLSQTVTGSMLGSAIFWLTYRYLIQ